MIAAGPHRSDGQKPAYIQGWLVSVLLHGIVVLAAVLLTKQIQLTPRNEAFKWNVAMASSAQPVQAPASPQNQDSAPVAPSKTSIPSPHMQQSMSLQTSHSPRPVAQQVTPSTSERLVAPVLTEPPTPPTARPTIPSQSAVHTIQPSAPVRRETGAPVVSEATSIVKSDEAAMGVSTDPADQTMPSNAPSAILEQTAQSDQVPVPMQMAAVSPASTNTSAKRDYGWLSEAILRRVEELKRYPASARVDRAEGKVVVKAVINEDGNVGEVEVFQSSGHPGLDKAAIDTLRQAAPFNLPRPLGQPGMTIRIPMSYRLDR